MLIIDDPRRSESRGAGAADLTAQMPARAALARQPFRRMAKNGVSEGLSISMNREER